MAQCSTEPLVVGNGDLLLQMLDDVFEFVAGANVQFSIRAIKVTLDGPDADLQLLRDLHIGFVLRGEARDFIFARGQGSP